MGGAWFEEHFGDPNTADPEELGDIAQKEIEDQLGIRKVTPLTRIVNIHKVLHCTGSERNLIGEQKDSIHTRTTCTT